MPHPERPDLPVIKFPPPDQDVPSYSSVVLSRVVPVHPPNFKPAVCVPHAPTLSQFVVDTFPPPDQDVPSYSSDDLSQSVLVPEKQSPAVNVPVPPAYFLAVFKFPPPDQDAPSYSSDDARCRRLA